MDPNLVCSVFIKDGAVDEVSAAIGYNSQGTLQTGDGAGDAVMLIFCGGTQALDVGGACFRYGRSNNVDVLDSRFFSHSSGSLVACREV
jgi:hypothetical protein